MTELILVRHGQTEWNHQQRYQGQTDIPLDSTGMAQARELAEQLRNAPLEAIFSSDLQRAHRTASILAEHHSLEPIVDNRLREIFHGEWEGMLQSDIHTRYSEHIASFHKDPFNAAAPGGETVGQLQFRVLNAVIDIAARFPEGPVAVVSHGLAIATLLAQQKEGSLDRVFELIPENAVPVYFHFSIPE
jgi:broad specificity phosphatase PhoE